MDKKGVQACRGGGARDDMVPPDFGRSVNPISTEEGKLCPHITSPPPRFSNLPKSLGSMMSCEIMLRFENAEIFAVKNKRLVLLARQQRQRLLLPIVCCVKESNP